MMLTTMFVSLFACESFEPQGRAPEAIHNYEAVIVQGEVDTESLPYQSSYESIPLLDLYIVETDIEELDSSLGVQVDYNITFDPPYNIPEDAPLMKTLRSKDISIGGLYALPPNFHERIEGEYQITIFRKGISVISTSDLIQSIIETTEEEIDVLYIPIPEHKLEGFVFDAINLAIDQGIRCFDISGQPIAEL